MLSVSFIFQYASSLLRCKPLCFVPLISRKGKKGKEVLLRERIFVTASQLCSGMCPRFFLCFVNYSFLRSFLVSYIVAFDGLEVLVSRESRSIIFKSKFKLQQVTSNLLDIIVTFNSCHQQSSDYVPRNT